MSKTWAAPLAAAAILLTSDLMSAEELEYISDDELALEWQNRQSDIERTKSRIGLLAEDEIRTVNDLNSIKLGAQKNEELTIARAKLFYRFFRNGGSLRYLLGSSSVTQFLKRLDQMKRLLEQGLTARRAFGLRLVEAQSRLVEIREARAQAEQMLSMLEKALQDLEQERRKRNIANPSAPTLAVLTN